MADEEVWRVCSSNPRYAVSSLGRVKRATSGPATFAGRVLRPWADSGGYARVNLRRGKRGSRKVENVAAIVAEAFIGPRPVGMEINHIDGVKSNNCVGNLEYVTRSANIKHAYRLGLQGTRRGVRNGRAKLMVSDVMEIRRRSLAGEPRVSVARAFGVTSTTVYKIACGALWSHV